jgi:hypothetical protein
VRVTINYGLIVTVVVLTVFIMLIMSCILYCAIENDKTHCCHNCCQWENCQNQFCCTPQGCCRSC